VVVGGGSVGGARWMVVVRGGCWWFRHRCSLRFLQVNFIDNGFGI